MVDNAKVRKMIRQMCESVDRTTALMRENTKELDAISRRIDDTLAQVRRTRTQPSGTSPCED